MKKAILPIVLALFLFAFKAQAQSAFITTWKTTTANESITIPINTNYSYNYNVNWGDGNTSSNQTSNATHTYASAGVHTISITGSFPAIQFINKPQLLTVEQWGSQIWQSMESAFDHCQNLTKVSTTDVPKFAAGISLSKMFLWTPAFNQDLNNWDVSNVTNMSAMFQGATAFNGSLSGWNTGSVTNMMNMFLGATSFNQDLNNWDVSQVTNMTNMFLNATAFNRDLSSWNVSNVQNMSAMFQGATAFNGSLSGWNTGSVTNMTKMFIDATAFNQDLSSWNVSNVQNMSGMFYGATAFNQDIGSWDVSKVTQMRNMFAHATAFNQDIGGWNVFKVQNMSGMFYEATAFNQDIGSWDVSNVQNTTVMFYKASAFNQNLGNWDISNVTYMNNMLYSTGLSTANYDSTLIGWAAQNVQPNVTLGALNLTYCASKSDRQSLIDDHGWTIIGDSKDPNCTASNPDAFITTWQTTTANESITIPINPSVSGYNYAVDWGDGSISSSQTGNATHTYASAGVHTISITGSFPAIQFINKPQLLTVEQWGSQVWQSMVSAFQNCQNLTHVSTTDIPHFANGISLSKMFSGASSFNQDLNNWDVSQVTDMSAMFQGATSFDGNISSWSTNNVTNMPRMFYMASSFNQDLNNWDVSNVQNMSSMFQNATSFNGNISNWNTGSVTNMSQMFYSASAFNQDLSSWDVSQVTDMSQMLQNATTFNQSIGSWDVSKVTQMQNMFARATAFNQDIGGWNVSKVQNMSGMFYEATAFNQDIGSWDVSNVQNTTVMFYKASAFNGDISGWNVSNVQDMSSMFQDASSFNQNLGAWNISNVSNMDQMLNSTGLSTANYDATLIGWAAQNVQVNVSLGAHGLTYCAGDSARQALIDNHGWTISGDSKDPNCSVSSADAFITTWKTSTANESITIPINPSIASYHYNYTVDWGDGSTSANQTGDATHTYASAGTHTVSITGSFPAIQFYSNTSNDANDAKLLTIEQWGTQVWQRMNEAFRGCVNLTTESATDAPNFAPNSSLTGMFAGCSSFNSDLNDWDVSKVSSMQAMFSGASTFNGNISSWNVSNVTNMSRMFFSASAFNQDLSSWDVSQVTNMSQMLQNATTFNQNIGSWDVSKVTQMQNMFLGAAAFNQDIDGWNVSKVQNMSGMFYEATAFNQDIGSWDISNVQNTAVMFYKASAFNGDISGWNVSNVQNMGAMFQNASSFNQNLGAWNISSLTQNMSLDKMLSNSGLSTANYDSTLIGWAAQSNIPANITLGATGLTYCAADSARQALIDNHGWTINGDAKDPNCIVSNAAPVITSLDGDVDTFTEGDLPLRLDAGADASVTDGDSPDFNGGNLTASITGNRAPGEDILGVYVTGSITTPGGGVLSFNGNPIGTFTPGSGTNDLVANFTTSAATPAAVQALIRALTYYNSNHEDPSTATRTIAITVNDGSGQTSAVSNVTVNLTGVNDPPTLSATGSATTFTEGQGPTSPLFSNVSINTVESTQGIKKFDLTVSNVNDGADEALNIGGVQVTLTNGNTGTIGSFTGFSVTLIGSTASVELYPTVPAILVSELTSLLNNLTYENSSTNPTLATRTIELTSIQDDGGTANGGVDVATLSISATVKVVGANAAPVITSNGGGSTATISIPENTTAVTTVTAKDADAGTTLTYSLSGGADQALFTINGTTGALIFNSAPDFENPADANGDNNYEVTVRASDGTNTDEQMITVTVMNENDNPPVITSNGGGSKAWVSIAENTTAVTSVKATDADAGTTLVYSLSGGADQGLFSIKGSSGILTFKAKPDFENPADDGRDNNYEVTVRASDGTHTVDQTITVAVTNLNDNPPVITSNGGGSAASVSIAEDTTAVTTVKATDADAGTTLVYSLSGGADQGLFSINGSSGVLAFKTKPDFENPADADGDNNYEVTVRASDGTHTRDQTITVAVTNVNDNTPVITSNGGGSTASVSIAENTTAVTTVKATDADAETTLVYSLSGGADQGLFSINGSTGVLVFKTKPDFENPADADGDNNYEVTVRASDGTHTVDQTITVAVTNVNEEFSIFINIPGTDTLRLNNIESSDSIQQIEHKIEDSTSIPADQQQLSFGGQVLEDGRTLAEYNIQQNNTLDLTIIPVIQPDANGILYVDSAIASPGDGSSWHKALQYFSDATQAAETNTAIKEIHVAKGTYYPTGAQSGTDRDSIFVFVRGGLKVLGGYPNGGGTRSLSVVNRTILSGNINNPAVNTDNSKHVVAIDHIPDTDSLILDGLQISDGRADANNVSPYEGYVGAGLYFRGNHNPIVVRNCILSNNMTSGYGGGIYNMNSTGGLVVLNSLFLNNKAVFGAAVSNALYSTKIINCSFSGNNGGGAVIYSRGTSTTTFISNSILWDNNAANEILNISTVSELNGVFKVANSIIRNGNPPASDVTYTNVSTSDPLFVDTTNGNYHLKVGSPAINVGINDSLPAGITTDLAGNARIYDKSNGGIVDLGAYEFQAAAVEITTQPQDTTVCPAASPSFEVVATGTNLSYQWQNSTDEGANWGNISGETATSLSLSNVQPSDSGTQYRVIVTGTVNKDTSSVATLRVLQPAQVVSAPQDTTVDWKGNAHFKVVTTGEVTGYQWQSSSDGSTWNNITGETAATLDFSNLKLSDSGTLYRVIVSSPCAALTTPPATLHVNPPLLTLSPGTLNPAYTQVGYSITFEAQGGTEPYQYSLSNSNLPTSFTFVNGQLSGTPTVSGTYTFTVTATDASTGSRAPFSVSHQYQLKVMSAGACMAVSSWPSSKTTCAGSDVSFAVTGTGIDGYQWQSKDIKSNTWTDISSATGATLTVDNTTTSQSGMQYRVLLSSNGCGTLSSQPVTLTVNAPAAITTQPVNQTVCENGDATFSVSATGTNLTYQWQSSSDGTTWNNVANATSATLNLSNLEQNKTGTQYHVIVSSACGNVTSASATLSVRRNAAITTQPVNQTVCENGDATFKVTATGTNLTYQWQSSSDGTTWNNVANATSATLNLSNIKQNKTGTQYRVIVSSACGNITSDAATLIVNANAAITTQPTNQVVCENGDATFKVTATGTNLTYQWQSSSDGTTWNNVANATSATLNLSNIKQNKTGTQYRVVVSSACGNVTSNVVTLNVNKNVVITTPPEDQGVVENGSVSFSVTASGTGLAYQWQSSTDRTSWNDITGATGATLSLSNIALADNGTKYRVVVTGACGKIISGSATLTVNQSLAIISQPTNQTVCENGEANFSVAATGTSLIYHWQSSADGINWNDIAGANAATLQLSNLDTAESGTKYRVVVSSLYGNITSDVVTLTVQANVTITTQPVNQTTCENGDATFSVSASGTNVTYQWQSSTDGSTWSNVTDGTSETLKISNIETPDNGTEYRVMVTSSCGNVTSASATLNVQADASITTQPVNQTTCENGDATFSVSASGTNVTYQWQSSTNGSTWSNVTDGTSETLKLSNIETSDNGTEYRVMVTSSCGNVTSTSATLNVQANASITTQPVNQTVCENGDAIFTVSASGTNVTYQWQSSTDGNTWSNVTDGTSETLKLSNIETSDNGTEYRVMVTSSCGNVTSGVATLTVNANAAITTQPVNQTVCENGDATFKVTATGTNLTYQWQSSSDGTTWNNVADGTSETLELSNIETSDNGTEYRVMVTSSCGNVTSGVATLTVNANAAITTQPVNQTVCENGDATFKVTATGTHLTYQWQSSTDGTTWSNVTSGTSETLKLSNLQVSSDGMKYRVLVNGACSNVTSDAVTLTVNKATVILTQPTNEAVCAGENAKFKVKAGGTNVKYQWQSSTNGTDWNNIASGTSEILKLSNLKPSDNGTQYRVVASGTCGNVSSAVVTLTVNALPSVTIVADSANPVSKGLPVQLTASGANSYQWASGPGIQSGWNSAVLTIRPMQDATYSVTGTTAAGCSATQSYQIDIIVDYKLICNNIVSPNGDGKNDRWIISNIDAYQNNEVMIFDRAGRMVYKKKNYNNDWNGTTIGRPLKEGTYYYVFKVDGGKKIFKGFIELLRTR